MRIRLRRFWNDKVAAERTPQIQFVNPYAMSETVTPKKFVAPEFKDGRFVLNRDEGAPVDLNTVFRARNDFKAQQEQASNAVAKACGESLRKPGFLHYLKDVIVSDVITLSGEQRKRAIRIEHESKAHKEFRDAVEQVQDAQQKQACKREDNPDLT